MQVLWLFLRVASWLGRTGCFFPFDHFPESPQRKAAAEEIDADKPAGQDVDEVV